ncbi:MAG: 3-oxoacyl-ACP reductase FabG [Acidobacteria bacterium]|nr:3-oxoacyl-ACP reductase FabG [Acidobacteriota bacterium]MCI0628050.1 3-oxoacyl-ACP reductase FabG [Acidobacteriota bacterium]MCI0718046.1 3-oxoacyl-ACP reductase FabG [Acidobacteriota bacterium]
MELKGQVALVTGASRGLGRAIGLVLAEKGADVVVNYHDLENEADGAVAEIRSLGRRTLKVRADVSVSSEVTEMFRSVERQFERLDILVNNAGTTRPQNIFETTEDDWHFILQNNLTSCFLCSKAAMQCMARRKSGRIVNISSVVAEQGALYGHIHYAASKSGMLGLTKTLARTAAPLGITVNAVAPGIIETELLRQTHGKEGVQRLTADVPLGLGRPRDVGLAVAFLCGEGGRYITGTTLDVNGGMYMR